MSEPSTRATRIATIVPGLRHWSVQDDRIDFRSDAYAVERAGRTVLIDPLPLAEGALSRFGTVEAICLTGSCHQRSAWRYRKRFGVAVFAPRGAEGLDEEADVAFRDGDILPGGLRAVHAPGPANVHYALLLERSRGVLFCADILLREGRAVRFISGEYQDDPTRTRRTARSFLDLRFTVLCFDHGAPLVRGAKAAIRRALAAGP